MSSRLNNQRFTTSKSIPPEDTGDISFANFITDTNLLKAIFDTSTLALHVLESIRDENGQIVDFYVSLANETSNKMAGRKVTGMRMLEGWPHTKEIGLFDKFVSAVESGQLVDYQQLYEGDNVKSWFRWLASKLNDGLYVTIEDITERKLAEETVQQTATNLQSILDGIPAIILLLEVEYDDENKPVNFSISSGNRAMADFFKSPLADLIGKKVTELFHDPFRGEILESHLKVYTTGDPINVEHFYPGADKWLLFSIAKQTNGKGVIVSALDITEKKKIENEEKKIEVLTSMDKLKTEFFGNVSHEFRTPLTLLLGPLEDILKNDSVGRLQRNKLEMAYRNALRVQKLVNSLLDFSRVEAGRFDTVFQRTDIGQFTNSLATNFKPAMERAGLQFHVQCKPLDDVYVNRAMWEKIVFNLLSNALKFTLKGKVELILQATNRHVQLQVRDTGIGISPADIPKIFERFTRIENTRARTFEGSGIGLALVKELVAMHGGKIKVKSQAEKGSEFTVLIPKGKKHLPAKMVFESSDINYQSTLSNSFKQEAYGWLPGSPNSTRRARESQRPIILVVDDNADMRDYIYGILKFDFEVLQANNGMSAKQILTSSSKPDLILSDIMMPEMSGYDLLKYIKGDSVLIHIPFIFLSAKASEEERMLGLQQGADGYLIKPFSAKELYTLVDSRIKAARERVSRINRSES